MESKNVLMGLFLAITGCTKEGAPISPESNINKARGELDDIFAEFNYNYRTSVLGELLDYSEEALEELNYLNELNSIIQDDLETLKLYAHHSTLRTETEIDHKADSIIEKTEELINRAKRLLDNPKAILSKTDIDQIKGFINFARKTGQIAQITKDKNIYPGP